MTTPMIPGDELFPQSVPCCSELQDGEPCVCPQQERVLRHYAAGLATATLTAEQRAWCIDEADWAWIERHDRTLWAVWQAVEEEYDDDTPVEVIETGDETVYLLREDDFALAVYGQSEPRLASWLFEDA